MYLMAKFIYFSPKKVDHWFFLCFKKRIYCLRFSVNNENGNYFIVKVLQLRKKTESYAVFCIQISKVHYLIDP